MSKLELKHLAPYLPYGLKGELKNPEYYPTTIGQLLMLETSADSDKIPFCVVDGYEDEISYFKPILHPLSDLTKEIEHNGEKFVPIVELLKLAHPHWIEEQLGSRYSEIEYKHEGWYYKACFKFMATKDISIHSGFMWNIPYWISEKLYEWHFDWKYGLIEKGLTIDINTLKNDK